MLTKKIKNAKLRRMWMQKIVFTLSLSAGLSLSFSAAAGTEHTGGADRVTLAETMFRSENPDTDGVSICFEKDESFKISDADITNTIRWSYQSWVDYIRLKEVYYAKLPGNLGIAMNVKSIHANCTEADDLTIFLGKTPDAVKPALATLTAPLAFTEEYPGYEKKEWKRGLMWFAKEGSIDAAKGLPRWTIAGDAGKSLLAFQKIMLHEMGHVFGNNHVRRTIMDQYIYYDVLMDMEHGAYRSSQPATIDSSYDELICNPGIEEIFQLKNQFGYTNSPTGGHAFPDPNAMSKVYALMTGKTATLPVTVIAKRSRSKDYKVNQRAEDQSTSDLTIEFTEGALVTNVVIQVLGKISQSEDSAPLFNGQYGNHHRSSSYSYFGMVKSLTGKSIPVAVNYNTIYGKLSIVNLKSADLEYPLLTSE